MLGNNVIWTIVGVLAAIALVVYLVAHVTLH